MENNDKNDVNQLIDPQFIDLFEQSFGLHEQQSRFDLEIGFTGTLIKQKCDYALYVSSEIVNNCLYMWHNRFYSDGRFMRFTTTAVWSRHCVDYSIETDEKYIIGKGQYSIWSGDKQVDTSIEGDKIIINGENNDYGGAYGLGGFNKRGDLILTLVVGKEGKTVIYPARYIGAVTDKKIVYGKDFKDFDESTDGEG
jgi:hypothetical protein